MNNKVILTSQYWDCECEHNYIHPKSLAQCPVCQATSDEQPDSRLNEVRERGLNIDESLIEE